ncbi:MAG: hypothetical protein ACXWT0_01575 [Methylobacter sp.]
MNIKAVAISSFARFILGGNVFSRLLSVVTRQQDKVLSGAEKRHAALEDIKTIGLELAEWAVNLGIELAVAWLKSKSDTK